VHVTLDDGPIRGVIHAQNGIRQFKCVWHVYCNYGVCYCKVFCFVCVCVCVACVSWRVLVLLSSDVTCILAGGSCANYLSYLQLVSSTGTGTAACTVCTTCIIMCHSTLPILLVLVLALLCSHHPVHHHVHHGVLACMSLLMMDRFAG